MGLLLVHPQFGIAIRRNLQWAQCPVASDLVALDASILLFS